MLDDLSAQLAAVKDKLGRKARFSDALPKARESLSQEEYQLSQLERALEHVENEIEALQSLTLQSLWDGILCRKQGKLDRLNEIRQSLQAKCDECGENVTTVEQTVASLEARLAELGNPDAELQFLLEQAQKLVLNRRDDTADRISNLLNDLDGARTARQRIDKAIQSGKHAIERLHSLTKAIGRANAKNMGSRPAGIIGAAVVNSVLRSGSRPALDRARQGLVQFGRDAAHIELNETSELDAEISRLTGVVAESEASLDGAIPALGSGDMGVTLPLLEVVQTLLGHLDTKLAEAKSKVTALEQKRHDLLEQALNEPDVSCAGEPGAA